MVKSFIAASTDGNTLPHSLTSLGIRKSTPKRNFHPPLQQGLEKLLNEAADQRVAALEREHREHVDALREEMGEQRKHNKEQMQAQEEKFRALLEAEKKRSGDTEAILQQQFDTYKESTEKMWWGG